jgi:hypothetical protein
MDQYLPCALASPHLRSRMSRMLYNNNVPTGHQYQPTKGLVTNANVNRRNAMASHIQSRRQRSNNRIDKVMNGSIKNKTTERQGLQHQTHQQPTVTSSLHQTYIHPQSAA